MTPPVDGWAAAPPPTLTLEVGPLAAPVLTRVTGALAAQAGLAVDRLNDARLVAEAVVAHAPAHTVAGRLQVAFEATGGRLLVRLGPLVRGGAEGLRRDATFEGVGSVLEALADDVYDETAADGEYLIVLFSGNGEG